MHKVLIIGEHDGKTLNPATAKCVTCAAGISDAEITIASWARTPRPWPRRPRQSRREIGAARGSRRERTSARRDFRAADRGAGRRLHSCLRPLDQLRQGSHAARRGAARRAAGQRLDGGRERLSIQTADLRRQCHRHGGGGSGAQAGCNRARRILRGREERRQRRHRTPRAWPPPYPRIPATSAPRPARPIGPTCRPPSGLCPAAARSAAPRISSCCSASPTRSARPSARRARRSMPATPRMKCRWARPERSSRPTSTSPSAFPARFNTSPASRTRAPSSRSTRTRSADLRGGGCGLGRRSVSDRAGTRAAGERLETGSGGIDCLDAAESACSCEGHRRPQLEHVGVRPFVTDEHAVLRCQEC
jgi:hypothetical protein